MVHLVYRGRLSFFPEESFMCLVASLQRGVRLECGYRRILGEQARTQASLYKQTLQGVPLGICEPIGHRLGCVRVSSGKQPIELSPSLAGETLGMPQLHCYGLGGQAPSHRSWATRPGST